MVSLNNKIMIRFKLPILLTFAVSMVLLSSCYYDNKEELYQNLNTNCETANVSFGTTIEPIITANCAIPGCHIGPANAGGLDLSTYQGVKSSADATGNGSLVGRITASSGSLMPQGGPRLPECDIQKIQQWVADGAPNN